jgi:hypothetical protein
LSYQACFILEKKSGIPNEAPVEVKTVEIMRVLFLKTFTIFLTFFLAGITFTGRVEGAQEPF